jgi:hypothetical protein
MLADQLSHHPAACVVAERIERKEGEDDRGHPAWHVEGKAENCAHRCRAAEQADDASRFAAQRHPTVTHTAA